ncbi:hypothetical protein KBC03_05005, partial [Patescibacteria group bacterium]|nr:hypothetical protein [Patescibacteria group bacterium]
FIAFQGFIGTVNKTIYYLNQRSRNADQEEVQISLMPTESAVCSIEALYFTKKLLAASTLKLDYFFGQPEAKVLTICFGMPPRDKICDGCNVFPPHEHRCHHGSMYIKDQPVKDAYCDCPGCRESETLMAIGAFRDEDFMKKLELFPN